MHDANGSKAVVCATGSTGETLVGSWWWPAPGWPRDEGSITWFLSAGHNLRRASMISDQAPDSGSGSSPTNVSFASAGGGPLALRIALGAHLRRLREASHITPADAGE